MSNLIWDFNSRQFVDKNEYFTQRQIEDQEISKKQQELELASQYTPAEAARRRSAQQIVNAPTDRIAPRSMPDNNLLKGIGGAVDKLENSKLWRTVIGNPDEGFGVGDMTNALLMANPTATAGAGIATLGKAAKATPAAAKAGQAINKGAGLLKGIVAKTPTPIKAGIGGGAAVTGAETIAGAVDPDYVNPISGQQTFPSKFGSSLRAGTGDTVGLVGSVAEWQGYDELGKSLKNKGKKISEGFEPNRTEFKGWQSFLDPEWYANNVAATLPTTASLIPLMIVGYMGGGKIGTKALASKAGQKMVAKKFGQEMVEEGTERITPFVKTIFGSLGGTALSRPLESALEAGGTYEDALARGMSEEQAVAAADRVYSDNLKLAGMDVAQLALTFAPTGKVASKMGKALTATGKVVGDVATESLEEGLQQGIQQRATGADTRGLIAQMWNPTTEMKESMAIGGLLGGGMGAVGIVNDMVQDIKARTIAELPDEVMPQVQSRVEELVNQGAEPAEAIDQVLDEMAEVPEVAEVVSRITQEEAEKTVENIAQIQPAATNQKVQDKKGNIFDVVDDSNPEFVVVKDSKGKTKMIDRGEAKDLEAGQPQAGEIGADSATVPEPEQNAPQAQGEANAVNVTESGVLEPVNVVADDIEGDVEPTQPINDINVATKDAAGETQADNVDVTKLPDHVLEDIISKAGQVKDRPGNKELLDRVIAEHEKRGLGKVESEPVPDIITKEDESKSKTEADLVKPEPVKPEIQAIEAIQKEEQIEPKPVESHDQHIEKAPAEPVREQSHQEVGGFAVTKTKHTKTGEDIWVAKLVDQARMSKEDFAALRSRMKKLGGNWSNFTKGFNFKEDPTEKLRSKPEVKKGDTVYSDKGEELTVVNPGNKNTMRVQDKDGKQQVVKKETVKGEKPADKPDSAPSRTVPIENAFDKGKPIPAGPFRIEKSKDSPGWIVLDANDIGWLVSTDKERAEKELEYYNNKYPGLKGEKPTEETKTDVPAAPIKNKDRSKEWLDRMEKEAQNRINSRKGRLLAGLPMDDMLDYSIIGMVKIARTGMDLATFTKEMIDEYGPKLKNWIAGIYAQSQAMLEMTEEDLNQMIEDARRDSTSNNEAEGVNLNQENAEAKEGEQDAKPDKSVLEPRDEEGTAGGRLPTGADVDSLLGTGGQDSGVSGQDVGSVAGQAPVQQGQSGGSDTSANIPTTDRASSDGQGPEAASNGADDSRVGQPGGDGKSVKGDTTGSTTIPGEPEGSADKAAAEGDQVIDNPLQTLEDAFGNFHINEENPVFVKGGKKVRFRANIAALKTLDLVLSEKREATQEEKRKLALFSGWGALMEAFTFEMSMGRRVPKYPAWEQEYAEVKDLLNELESKHFGSEYNYRGGLYDNAAGSVMNAHYTSPAVIGGMYQALEQMGYKKGNLLEPSMGTGNFFGMLPLNFAARTKLFGVELDPVTGKIAQLLYPNADIRIQGFQDAVYPKNFFDVAVGNVPFGNYHIADRAYPNFVTERIHNYFFAKTVDKVRPGGVVAFITSSGTMDAEGNERVRQYLAQKANLLGAIRLPGDAFKENAGTEVTTDIIFLQKLKDGELPGDIQWTGTVKKEIDEETYSLNQYYNDHPDMVLGEFVKDKLTGGRLGVKSTGQDIEEAIAQAIEKLPKNVISNRGAKQTLEMTPENALLAAEMLDGGITLKDSKLYRKIGDSLVQITENVAQIKQLVQIRELAKEVLAMQRDPEVAESDLEAKRAEMKKLYDAYVKKHDNFLKTDIRNGRLWGRPHIEKILGYAREIGSKDKKGKVKTEFTLEPETYLLKSLEIEIQAVDDEGNIKQEFKPSQIMTQRTYKVVSPVDKVDNAQDGLVASLNQFGYVDMDHIVEIYGKSEEEIAAELGDKIYKNPLSGWETADEYLSGNVKKKLREAQERADYEPEYSRNVEALSKVIPKDVPFADITVNLGDGWVPFHITEAAVKNLLGFTGYRSDSSIKLEYSPLDNKWNLSKGTNYRNTAEMAGITAGVPKDPLAIVKIALNNTETIIKTTVDGKTFVNQEATNALKAKVKEIRQYLKEYLSADLDAMNEVEEIYNDKFNATVPRDYSKIAEYFTFPNMNPDVELRPHQKNAIVRALMSGNSLLAHGVGAGKTFEQIGIAMEAKRLGLANKPLLVVPNTKLTDFESDAKLLYPGAKVLALSQDDFEGNSIKRTLALAAVNDWDMVIVRHSSFSKIPVSPETELPALQAEIQELEAMLEEMTGERGFTVKKLQARLEKLRAKLHDYQENRVQYEGLLNFEDMGFDMLIVDEAHEYKNYPLTGKASSIKGLASGDADKARDMMIKSGYIRKLNGGNRGVVFGTGTPISNSMAEVFVMFKYLRPDLLREAGISHFDAWADAFSNITEVAEVSAKGEFRNKMQFKSFVNLPELITLFREFTDIKMQDTLNLPLPKHEIVKVECEAHPQLAEVMAQVEAQWADAIKSRQLFRLINIVLNAPQDIRLVIAGAINHSGSKVNKIANNVKEVYDKTAKEKGTQLIFATTGESSLTGFSLWTELETQLIKKGIPANEIAFIKTGTKEEELEEIYRKINAGKIRVAIGSFSKMGVGINVQERLFAIHELNAPYRPADIEQAEGRMIRQGNTYYDTGEKVRVYRYVTVGEEGAFSGDAFKWQILENKVKSINAVMKGDPSVRVLDAFDEDSYDAATMKAIAIGDERYIRKVELEGEIDVLRSSYNAYKTGLARAQRGLTESRKKIRSNRDNIHNLQRALKTIEEMPPSVIEKQIVTIGGEKYTLTDKDSKKAADEAIKRYIAEYEAKPKNDSGRKQLANIQGMTLMYEQKYNNGFGSMIQGFALFADYYTNLMKVESRYVKLDKNNSSKDFLSLDKDNIFDAIFRKIKSFQREIDKMLKENDVLDKEVEKYEQILKQPFKHQEELDEKRAELREIDAALNIGTVAASGEAGSMEGGNEQASLFGDETVRSQATRTPDEGTGEKRDRTGKTAKAKYKRDSGAEVAPVFYSQLRRIIEQKMPNKAVPNQVLAIVKGGQVKAEEVKWSGIEDWLKEQTGRVSKEDVLAFIDANNVQIEEVEKAEEAVKPHEPLQLYDNNDNLAAYVERNETGDGWVVATSDGEYHEEYEEYNHARQDLLSEQERIGGRIEGNAGISKYSQYVLPGGENYQELLFTLPSANGTYKSQHWDEPNVLAHVRFNDHTGADGEKIILVEEIQSDWHQEGRKKGYKNSKWEVFDPATGDIKYQVNSEEEAKKIIDKHPGYDYEGPDTNLNNNVPNAPFKKSWQELVLKRMLRYAAENGYDRIAWTTGEQQAERYDLSKKVKYIGWKKHSNGRYHVTVKDLELNLIYNEREKTIDDIEKFAGKEIARKIQSSTENNGVIEGDNLKVGGSGMKAFYNQMLPAFLNKYVKKWGAKVEPATIGGEVGTVQSVPITNAMKKSVLYDGQPKFKFADDVAELNEALGADKFNLKYAPEAMEREDMQAADIIARLISDSQIVPFTGTESPQGVAFGQNIFLNEKTKAPHMYVAKHEMMHRLGDVDPDALAELLELTYRYALSDPRIQRLVKNHYLPKGYEAEDVWEEFTADITSEVMEEPGFWQKVREQSPELLKIIVDIIDEIISRFKKAVSDQESMLKYVKDMEGFRNEVAGVMARSLQRRPRNLLDLQQADAFAAKTRAKQKQADAKPQYSVRKKAPPKKTIKAYKLMRIDKQGRLYPLFVDRTVETPQGVWLDAKEGKMITTKTGGQKVKSSLGGLAYRPGWHLGDIPLATHIGVKGSSGNIEYMNPDHVWVECEVAADHNYQDQANANGINPKTGRLNKARADLKKIPVDGFYRFKTNPNMTGEWIITGAMKINRILGDEEAARLVRDAGYEPLPRKPKEPAQKQNKPSKAPAKGASLLDGIGGKPKLKRSEPQGPRLTLPDSEVQERMEASRGLKPETLKEKLKAALADIARKGHREFEWLPRTRQFSELRNALLKLRKQKGVAADETLRILDDVTKNLNEYEYDIFTYKVIFDDLAHEFAETRLLPFGLTEENFERNKTAIDQEAENNPKVMEAIEKRRQAWQSIKDKYVKAQKAVGFKVEDKLKKQDYYRHQVLEYANAKGMIGSGKKLRTPAGRGFLKERAGSTFDINTDYLQAEFEVMAQMLYDTEIAGVVRVVKEHYDVVDQLKRQAIEQNDAGMMEYFRDIIEKYDMDTDPEKLYRKLLNKKQAIAFSQLYKMAARGELPNDNGKYDRIIEAMAEADQTGQVEDEMQGQMFRYLNYLTGQMESEDALIKARTVYKGMAEKQRMIKNTLGQAYVTWEDLIPEGYSLWQPRDGHMFYMASSIPEGIAEELAAGIAQHVGIDASMVRKVMVVGRNYPELVVPEEVALTLENLYKNIGDGPLKKWYEGYRKVYRSWKQWQLISPRRFFRYNIRNVTGDLDALLAGNAKALKKTPQAWKELWQAFFAKDHTYTPELYEWFKRGGFETLMQAQEINDINRNRQFRHLMESRMKQTTWERILKSPATGWNKYWDGVRASTDFREALLRYACYLDYLEQMQSNNGVPKNWGASNQDEIMGLSDVRDRAAKMANELLGAYDEVSVIGTALADNLMPFWRWNEVNFVRYSKLIRNSYRDGKLMATIAGQATGITIRSPFIAWKVGTFVLKASFLLAMLNVWNMMFFRDEEDELSDDVKERAHIILGRNKDGTIRYFSRLGALQDFVDWFGLDTPVQTVTNFLNGRKTLKETAIDIAKQDANKLISALTPFFKNTGEILVGWKLFPDAFDPIRIRDRWEYLFDSFGLKSEYRAATGKPTKGYLRSLPDVFYYTSDPYETAYFANKENISRFKKKIGKDSTGYSESKRSDALYNLKMAMRYQDRDAMEKYLLEYVALGGTSKGLKQSLKTMSPLYGLNDVEKQAYVAQLDAEGRTELAKAIEYYLRVIDPQGQSQSEDQE